jgi:GNAT superfamily N-acetyltransferase
MTLAYTPATQNDRAFFIQVHHAAYRDVVERQYGWDQALQDQKAHQSFDRVHGHAYVVHRDGEKIGFVGYIDHLDHMWIEDIILLPAYQGQGAGREIIMMLQAKARAAQKPLRLQVLKMNQAKSLYERCGFVVSGTTETHNFMECS